MPPSKSPLKLWRIENAQKSQNRFHRRGIDRVHEKHHRRRAVPPGAERRDGGADGPQSGAARRSAIVAGKLSATLGASAKIETHADQKKALQGADFVVVAFQIGGYEPSTVIDFEVPKKYGLRHTIADTLGVGGIMRGLDRAASVETVRGHDADLSGRDPDAICQPDGDQYWAISAKYPKIRQVGLCHSVQGTAEELARDLDMPIEKIRYRAAGINDMAFYLNFEERMDDGSFRNLYPDLLQGYRDGRFPSLSSWNPRCPNKVRYEMLTRLGYFVTESSEHFAEYTPYFIKEGRDDLIEKFGIPLDEYPKRCIEQIAKWKKQSDAFESAEKIEVEESHEYASSIMNSVWTGEPSVIYGNQRNNGCITSLPDDCAAEVPCLVDENGIQPTFVGALPKQLTALIRTNINVQELTVHALMTENREHIFHAAMMDPHAAAELDLDQIWSMTEDMISAHGAMLPGWTQGPKFREAAE